MEKDGKGWNNEIYELSFAMRTIKMYWQFGAIVASLTLGFSSFASSEKTERVRLRQETLIDADWRFHPGEVTESNQVIAKSYDDAQWQQVQLPHDYGLDGAYDPTNLRQRGYLPVDVAWYRKHFSIPKSDQGKILQLEFGGIFRDSQVWLNGEFLGSHASGYTGFHFDITKAARCGEDNVIVVRVDPREREGWWYEGAGIYRHVYYHAMSPVHVANYGTYVIATVPNGNEGAADFAELTIETAVENHDGALMKCEVVSEIVGPDGKSLNVLKTPASVEASGQKQLTQKASIPNPRLWSLETPQLYRLHTTILRDGVAVDSTWTPFGIRTIHFDAGKGFFLNGKHVKIYGVANHQDFPAVGIAVPDSLQPWRVKRLKDMGCNGWRTAHNPPDESVLDACDRLGMLVMDENRHLGDSRTAKTPAATIYTNVSDLAWMIQRDRNHPCIIMWSMCNEEGLQGKPEGAKIFSAMKEVVHRYDRTRPITSAMNKGWLQPGIADVDDLIGVNYNPKSYDDIHRAHPNSPMFGSETANTKTTRGVYENDSVNGWASAYNMVDENLPNNFSPGICRIGWPAVASRAFMSGSFTWTGFDYKGEPNPFGWPDISNNTGLMDVCGFPKDKYYYLKSCWTEKPMVHLMPMTWNWPGKEGQNIRVVAFSNARAVELILNGKSFGKQNMPKDSFAEWKVPYEPGRLMAKGYTDGRVTATDQVETTDAAARIELSTDRKILQADGQDALVVAVSILDAKGRVVHEADSRVSFQLEGGGRILGVGNGNPSDHDTDRANQRRAFHGHCIAIVQAGAQPESLKLTASSPGLKPATVRLQCK